VRLKVIKGHGTYTLVSRWYRY